MHQLRSPLETSVVFRCLILAIKPELQVKTAGFWLDPAFELSV